MDRGAECLARPSVHLGLSRIQAAPPRPHPRVRLRPARSRARCHDVARGARNYDPTTKHQAAFGCVPLPPSISPEGSYGGVGFGAVKGPELAVCRSDRAACLMAQYARVIAEADADRYVGTNPAEGGPGGRGSALQHVTWSALLSVFIGRQQAELYLHTHEAANPAREGVYNQMDRANNVYGLRLVAGLPCVCLNLGEALSAADLAGQAERLASQLRPKIRREVDAGRVCTVAETAGGQLQLSRGCGQPR